MNSSVGEEGQVFANTVTCFRKHRDKKGHRGEENGVSRPVICGVFFVPLCLLKVSSAKCASELQTNLAGKRPKSGLRRDLAESAGIDIEGWISQVRMIEQVGCVVRTARFLDSSMRIFLTRFASRFHALGP